MEYQTIANPDGTISIVPINQQQGIMVPAYETSQLDLVNQINQGPRNIGAPMTLEETMAGSVLPPDPRSIQSIFPTNYPTGIMTQTQTPDFKRFQGITEETDIDDDTQDIVEEQKKSSGILDLIGMFIPGFNFLKNLGGEDYQRFDPRASIKGGIYKIGDFNQPANMVNDFYNPRTGLNRFERAQKRYERTGSVKDLFASSRSGAEFFRNLRERKAANQRALETAAKRKRDIQQFTGGGGGDGPQIQDRPATTSQGLTTSQFQAFRN